MLKLFYLTGAMSTSLILLTAKIAFNQPISGSYQHLNASIPNIQLSCYMQRPDGTTIDLSRLCKRITTPILSVEQDGKESEEEQRNYEADLNNLINQKHKLLPDRNILINSICKTQGKCPPGIDNIDISIPNNSR